MVRRIAGVEFPGHGGRVCGEVCAVRVAEVADLKVPLDVSNHHSLPRVSRHSLERLVFGQDMDIMAVVTGDVPRSRWCPLGQTLAGNMVLRRLNNGLI